MAILIGTSGFSYEDWRGHFYPPDLQKRDMLAFYSRRFPAVEVNATYYALVPAATFVQMCAKVPPGFRFAVKANREMTHGTGEVNAGVFAEFRRSLEPLQERGMLGCVLAQFPWSFRRTRENEGYLAAVREALPDLPVVVEFRNAGWCAAPVFAGLRELGFGFCCVDEPRLSGLMPQVAEATSAIGYVRFHGRNAEKWWHHEQAYERYDYLYSEPELEEWLPRIRKLEDSTEHLYLFFNNHYEGKAAHNARQLARLLKLSLDEEVT